MGIGALGPIPEMVASFGLGFAVRVDAGRNPWPGSVGDFSWVGSTGSYFQDDPKEKLVAVLMVEDPGQTAALRRQMRMMVYQAMID